MRRPAPIRWVRAAMLSRRIRREQCGVILMYHRIAPTGVDPWQLLVTPEHFAQHLEVLRHTTTPVPLRRLVAEHGRGRLAGGTVALTFDDGYVDNLTVAKPLLAAADIPATVYVATGPTGTTREFWWDSLDRALLLPPALPPRLDLTLLGKQYHWTLGAAATGGWDDEAARAVSHQRAQFHLGIWSRLRPMATADRDEAIAYLHEWSGSQTPPRQSHRVMTADELVALESDRLIEIGAHTVTHPLLPALPADAQRSEMAASRADLERLLGHRIWSFSYPFGGADATTTALARSVGFESATAVHEETVWRESDGFRLPRFAVRDWDGAEFERRLTRWLRQHVAPET